MALVVEHVAAAGKMARRGEPRTIGARSRTTRPRSVVVYADRGTRQRQGLHLPRVKVGCQRLSGQKRTEMRYCPQLCSNDTLSGVAGT